MSDYAAFYAAVLANPDDDLPRLTFADWLEEHDGETVRCPRYGPSTIGSTCGQPCPVCRGRGYLPNHYAARAELIRIQVQATGDERGLLKDHGRLWCQQDLGDFAEWTRGVEHHGVVTQWWMVRGFIGHISLTLAAWEQHAEEIDRRVPVRGDKARVTILDLQAVGGIASQRAYYFRPGAVDNGVALSGGMTDRVWRRMVAGGPPFTSELSWPDAERAALHAEAALRAEWPGHVFRVPRAEVVPEAVSRETLEAMISLYRAGLLTGDEFRARCREAARRLAEPGTAMAEAFDRAAGQLTDAVDEMARAAAPTGMIDAPTPPALPLTRRPSGRSAGPRDPGRHRRGSPFGRR